METAGRTSAVTKQANLISHIGGSSVIGSAGLGFVAAPLRNSVAAPPAAPLTPEARAAALEAVDRSLVKAGILEKVGGDVPKQVQAELGFEVTTCLPTQAIVVKGCIDECNVCEPSRQRAIDIELERKQLENQLLARQIELLEKSQEYRCCAIGEEEVDPIQT